MNTRLYSWSLLPLMLLLGAGSAIAQKPQIIRKASMTVTPVPSRQVEVTFHCFSGRPDPVMTLTTSEVQEYLRLLGQFVTLREGEEEPRQLFSFYRGMTIRDSGDKPARFLLYGRRMLNEDPQLDEYDGPLYSAKRIAPGNSLELYLLEIARYKVLGDEVYQAILKDAQEKSERGRIQRMYEVGFFANMGHMMLEPSEVQEYRRLRSQFKELTKQERFAMDINKDTGGVEILELDDRGVSAPYPNSQRFFGRRSITLIKQDENGVYWWHTGKIAPDNALQHYILDLGLKKGVISEDVYQQILKAVEEMPPYPR